MNWTTISKNSVVRSGGIVSLGVVFLLTVAWLQGGKSLVEKTATLFLMPSGMVWLLLSVNVLHCLFERRRWAFFIGCVLWIFHWVFASDVIARNISESLESPFEMVDPTQQEYFDYALVLGGGEKNYDNQVAVGPAGDRIVLAARLFHAGRIKQLVVSGERHAWSSETTSIADVTEKLLIQLKIPASAITKIKGRNTFEEFRELRSLMAAESIATVGVITSATHMPRAMRLAVSNGLNAIPLPADFEREMPRPLVLSIIPSQIGLRKSTRSLKEYLAYLASR